MRLPPIAIAALCAVPGLATAQAQRQLPAHEHGVSVAQISFDGATVVIDLTAPGMDIVGFEYKAKRATDRDAVAQAIRRMAQPETIVTLPAAAGCRLSEVLARLHTGEVDHAEAYAHTGDEDHTDEDHAESAEHGAFHARYTFSCETPDAVTEIGFPFFDTYPNAQEIAAQYVTATGSGRSEIGRDDSTLSLD